MKVWNLTDVPTAQLQQHSMVDHTFAVGRELIAPGTSVDVEEASLISIRGGLQQLVAMGVACVGTQPPASYVLAKERLRQATAPSTPAKVSKKGN